MSEPQLNVFGRVLKTCSNDPLTGFLEMVVVILHLMIKGSIQYVQ